MRLIFVCLGWLDSELQYLGPAPGLQQRLWTSISGPAAPSASSLRTPGHCLAKLISGCLSVADGVSNFPCSTEEQKGLHCPSCGHSPVPQCWLPDSLTSSAAGQWLCTAVPAGKWWSQMSSAEEVCNTMFVQTSPLTRETPKHVYSSQSSPWG